MMKQLTYCVIVAMSITLSFSGGKPCCNKKATKNPVACKFNQAAIGEDKNPVEGLTADAKNGDQKSYKCNISAGNQCAKSTKKSWWKFWTKESSENCPCKQVAVTKTLLQQEISQ